MYSLPRQTFTILTLYFALSIIASDMSTKEYIIFPPYGIRSEEAAAFVHLIKNFAERDSVYTELARGSSIPFFWTANLSAANYESLRRSPVVIHHPSNQLDMMLSGLKSLGRST